MSKGEIPDCWYAGCPIHDSICYLSSPTSTVKFVLLVAALVRIAVGLSPLEMTPRFLKRVESEKRWRTPHYFFRRALSHLHVPSTE